MYLSDTIISSFMQGLFNSFVHFFCELSFSYRFLGGLSISGNNLFVDAILLFIRNT